MAAHSHERSGTSGRRQLLIIAVAASFVASAALPVGAAEPPPDVARTVGLIHDLAPAEVAQLLADPTVVVTADGRVRFVEPPAPAGSGRATPVPGAVAEAAAVDAFALHSRPGSRRVIFLDFDGYRIRNTEWNEFPGTPDDFVAVPFSVDANPAFSATEKAIVTSVWQRVAEDFAPFDVDVTTQAPGSAAITRSGPGDQRYGTRVLISDMDEIAERCGCGGVAYLDVFSLTSQHNRYQPALVFSDNLGDEAKTIAEAASHEAGHTLSLLHDGQGSASYYRGHGAWAPIMGVGYDRPIVQWSKGEYNGSTTRQNDLNLIANSGAPLAADDHGNAAGQATALGSGPQVQAAGIIGTDADVDAFKVVAGAGPATFTVVGAAPSPNLDAQLELRTASGALIATANPPSAFQSDDSASGLSASISANLPAQGTYVLLVTGVGHANPAINGYSGYGSLGRYTLAGQVRTP